MSLQISVVDVSKNGRSHLRANVATINDPDDKVLGLWVKTLLSHRAQTLSFKGTVTWFGSVYASLFAWSGHTHAFWCDT